jgi:IS30 family transposase
MYKRMTLNERETVLSMLSSGSKQYQIAKELNRHPSSISRELKRIPKEEEYRPSKADRIAKDKAKNSHRQKRKLDRDEGLKQIVFDKLKLYWSPHQISYWLKHKAGLNMTISPQAIYSYLHLLPKGQLKVEVKRYLRQHMKPRGKSGSRGCLPDMVIIDERPADVADRVVPGHWEGDLIMGKDNKTAIGTLVERQTRFVILVPLKQKDAVSVRKAFAKAMLDFPQALRKTLTYDQGKEMAQHKKFGIQTDIQVYFCHPSSPWERGTNENINGLIRQFFPKGTDFSKVTKGQLKKAQDLLNERPRKVHQWSNPKEKMEELLLLC